MSFCVSRMHSARLEIGTQTSVAHMPQPGLAALAAQAASWRPGHILLGSSAWPVRAEAPPPLLVASARTISGCPLVSAPAPWDLRSPRFLLGGRSLGYRV